MRIMIVQLGRIGDLLLITPMFSALKKKFPDCQIDVFAGRNNYKIIENNPNLNKIFIFEKSFLGYFKTIYNIFINKYNYYIDPKDHFSTESKIFAKINRSKNKIGYNLGRNIFNIEIPVPNRLLHHSEIGLNSLLPLGINLPDKLAKPELFINEVSNIYLDNFLKKNNISNYFALNLSASTTDRMWDNEKWNKLLNSTKKENANFLICSSPKEKNQAIELSKRISNAMFFPTRDINDVVALVSKSNAVITPDTALVHISAAFNKPLFALYNGIEDAYSKFFPLSDYYISIKAPIGDFGIQKIDLDYAIQKLNEFFENITRLSDKNIF